MLSLMHGARDTGRLPPISKISDDHRHSPGDSRYENRSLERYTDLRFARHPRRRHRRWVFVVFGLVAMIPLVIVIVMAAIYWHARHDDAQAADAIVVMGAAQYNGRP